MACRSVDNLRCRDDLMNVYRANAHRSRRGSVKIRDIIGIIKILGPVVPHFFERRNGANVTLVVVAAWVMLVTRMTWVPALGLVWLLVIMAMVAATMATAHGHGHGHSHSHGESHYGMSMGHVDDYADHEISEEEFERLLDYAEQCNVKMY
ncbi:hypothetical protein SDJN03_08156, partial [Cucurbita argyrosperma subsp. sororia]